jgi:predicted deacylase
VRESIEINGQVIKPGTRQSIDIPLPSYYDHGSTNMPLHVVHGRKPGPTLLVTAAVHGDELNGVEIVRRILAHKALNRIAGTLIAIPVVNVFGFFAKSRYLPDRRDLNRSFPGSETGSMASRIANLLMSEIVPLSSHIIDLHTGAINRENLPQIRAWLGDNNSEVEAMAEAFGVPVILNAEIRDNSFRAASSELGIPTILYEAGEALRFDEVGIRAGVNGILGVMSALGMRHRSHIRKHSKPLIANTSKWVRAGQSGILRSLVATGAKVEAGEVLAYINDPLGENSQPVISPQSGIIVGKTNLPLVFEGEAVFHIAGYKYVDRMSDRIEAYHEELDPSPGDDSDEPPLV